jgi:hypothetical protein
LNELAMRFDDAPHGLFRSGSWFDPSGSTLPSRRLSTIVRSTLTASVLQPELATPQLGTESRVSNVFLMRMDGSNAGSKGFISSGV